MPRASVWIRNDDWAAWQAVPNKSLLISTALRPASFHGVSVVEVPSVYQEVEQAVMNQELEYKISSMKPRSIMMCSNGHPIPQGRSRCLGKACRYA